VFGIWKRGSKEYVTGTHFVQRKPVALNAYRFFIFILAHERTLPMIATRGIVLYLLLVVLSCTAHRSLAQEDLLQLHILPADTNKVNMLNELAYQQWNMDPVRGIALAGQALNLADSLGFKKGSANAYKMLGICYWSMGSYEPAIEAYLDGLRVAQHIKDAEIVNRIEHNLALVYEDTGDLEKAIFYLRKNLAWHTKRNDWHELPRVLNNLGTAFYEAGQIDSSLYCYERALQASPEKDLTDEARLVYINMSAAFLKKREVRSALTYCEKATHLYEQANDNSGLVECYRMFGRLHLAAGKYNLAESYLQRAFHLARVGNFAHFYSDLYNALAQTDSARGNYKLALTNFKKSVHVRDSLLTHKQQQGYRQLLAKYQADQAEMEQQLQKQKAAWAQMETSSRQQVRLVWTGSTIVVVALIAFFAYKRKQYYKRILQASAQPPAKTDLVTGRI
jgi:tetratricopeptide (TPR) repeat protein